MYYLQLLFYDYVFKWAFRYHLKVWNGCHDLMQKAMNFNNVAIVSVKENRYMNKDGVTNVIKNSDLEEKSKYF